MDVRLRRAADQLKRWVGSPLAFVRDQFGVEPDVWQAEVLEAFPHRQRIAMKASKGPGKTAVLAWLAWFFLATKPHPKIAAVAITRENLQDNLWTEMAKWQQRSEYLKANFDWQRTRIVLKASPETWWMSARGWSKGAGPSEQANTLAGLHSDYILFLLDESGGIPDPVMATAEAALASCKEGRIVQAGNPTHLEGPLWRACTSQRGLWHVVSITSDPDDPQRSTRVHESWAREQIAAYGRDNPWVLVNVFGQFPPSSINTLIGPDEVEGAMGRHYREVEYERSARVLGVDVSRFGDDASVIFPRQGLVAFAPHVYRNLDSVQGSGAVARKWVDWQADQCFIDDTGGFGAGWIDGLRLLGHEPVGVGFATRATSNRYENKRAEIYFELVNWIKQGGSLPRVPELVQALTQTTYSFKGDRLLLESKEQLKDRLGFSPDHADALALTFAYPVARDERRVAPLGEWLGAPGRHVVEYDPMGELWAGVGKGRADSPWRIR